MKNYRKRKGINKNCERCNKSFYVPPSQKNRRFCSKACSKNREIVKCICGKVFEARKSSDRKYCSSICYNKAAKGRKAHPNTLKAIKKRSALEKERNDQKGLNKKNLIESIINNKISPPELAKMIGVSHATVLNRMREYGITPTNYPELVDIRKLHKAKGNLNRPEETKKAVSKKVSESNKLRWLDPEFKTNVSKKISIARDSKIEVECSYCGQVKKVSPSFTKKNKEFFCNKECRASFLSDGNAWNYLNGGAGYDVYSDQISFAENIRRSKENEKVIEVVCTYCGKWFKPSGDQLQKRVKGLNQLPGGEGRFYCSDGCKKACPIFRKRLWPEGYKSATSREVQPELRQMRLECDGYICQKCHRTIDEAELHCHHITGVEQNPIESADVDNCITLCKKCHKWAHTQEGCRYFELMCK